MKETKKAPPVRRVMTKLQIDELSSVDRPAQEGALGLLLKRDDSIEKRLRLATTRDGHSHLFDDSQDGGHTSYDPGSDGMGHSHPWVRGEDGSITIGVANGHSHGAMEKRLDAALLKRLVGPKDGESEKDFVSRFMGSDAAVAEFPDEKQRAAVAHETYRSAEKRANTEPADDPPAGDNNGGETVDPKELQKQLDETKAALERANKLSELNDAQRAVFAKMSESEKTAFLAKTPEQRESFVKALGDQDPVEYTDSEGVTYRKSAGEGVIALAKRADAALKTANDERERRENTEFSKRASDEMGNLPGEERVKVAVLRAFEGIKDADVRKGAFAILKSANSSIAKALETNGIRTAEESEGEETVEEANDKLETLAKKHAADNKVSLIKARVDVQNTEEGRRLVKITMGA